MNSHDDDVIDVLDSVSLMEATTRRLEDRMALQVTTAATAAIFGALVISIGGLIAMRLLLDAIEASLPREVTASVTSRGSPFTPAFLASIQALWEAIFVAAVYSLSKAVLTVLFLPPMSRRNLLVWTRLTGNDPVQPNDATGSAIDDEFAAWEAVFERGLATPLDQLSEQVSGLPESKQKNALLARMKILHGLRAEAASRDGLDALGRNGTRLGPDDWRRLTAFIVESRKPVDQLVGLGLFALCQVGPPFLAGLVSLL